MDTKDLNTELHQYTEQKRKELKEISKKWDGICTEAPGKFMQLLKSGMKPKIERGNTGNSRQLSVSMSFEMNTDSAKEYLEEVKAAMEDVNTRIANNMSEMNKKIEQAYEANADPKEVSSLIKLFASYYEYAANAELKISNNTIKFEMSEDTTNVYNKWKKADQELSRVIEANRLGVDISMLDTHKKYLDAKRKQTSAKTSASKRQAARLFSEISTYLDAEELAKACNQEADVLKQKEDEAERLRLEEEERQRREAEARRLEEERQKNEAAYVSCLDMMSKATSSKDYQNVIDQWKTIEEYKDVKEKIQECTQLLNTAKQKEEEAERLRLEEEERQRIQGLYDEALFAIKQGNKDSYKDALVILKELGDYKDAKTLIVECESKIAIIEENEAKALEEAQKREQEEKERREKEKQEKQKKKKTYMNLISLVSIIIIVISIIVPFYRNTIAPSLKYNKAMNLVEDHQYDEAYALFEELGSYKDSEDMLEETRYQQANYCFENKDYETAMTLYDELGTYEDSSKKYALSCYNLGMQYYGEGNYEKAVEALSHVRYSTLYKSMYYESAYQYGLWLFDQGQYEEGYEMLMDVSSYSDAKAQAQELYYQQGLKFYDDKDFDKSNAIFKKLGTYKDSATLIHYHSYTQTVVSELTCEQNGEIIYTCACGYTETKVTETTGHQYTDATCTEPSKCSSCGLVQSPALGHTLVNNVCSTCGYNATAPMTFSGSASSNTKENIHTITVPKGTYKFTITATTSSAAQRWSVAVDGYSLYFGSNAAAKSGTFTAEHVIKTDNASTKVVVKINGKYTLKIEPINN